MVIMRMKYITERGGEIDTIRETEAVVEITVTESEYEF